ncbi:MAG: hypothetical protein M5U15_10505 [Kiritimatiellae bacterium]|nr:hypothetical protein [Kiritimatiellia bacterium]
MKRLLICLALLGIAAAFVGCASMDPYSESSIPWNAPNHGKAHRESQVWKDANPLAGPLTRNGTPDTVQLLSKITSGRGSAW